MRFSDYKVVSWLLLAFIVDIFYSFIWPALQDSIALFKTSPLLVEGLAQLRRAAREAGQLELARKRSAIQQNPAPPANPTVPKGEENKPEPKDPK